MLRHDLNPWLTLVLCLLAIPFTGWFVKNQTLSFWTGVILR